jgi:hypothetical protein
MYQQRMLAYLYSNQQTRGRPSEVVFELDALRPIVDIA